MFQINVQSFAIMPQSKEIQCCSEKVSEIKIFESSQDKNFTKMMSKLAHIFLINIIMMF